MKASDFKKLSPEGKILAKELMALRKDIQGFTDAVLSTSKAEDLERLEERLEKKNAKN